MLTLFCGDNATESRSQFGTYKKKCAAEGSECVDLSNLSTSGIVTRIYNSTSLFSQEQVFFAENIFSRKASRDGLKDVVADPQVELVVWEGTMDERDLKRYFPKARILASKLPTTIWKFLDSVYPGSARKLIMDMQVVIQTVDENMLLYLIQRRVKDLILGTRGLDGKRKLAPWQVGIMKSQAARWGTSEEERLTRLHKFYRKLYDIEVGVKTSTLPYPIHKALDILFSFYVQ